MRQIRITVALIAMGLTLWLTLWQIRLIGGQEAVPAPTTEPVMRIPCKVIEVVDGDTVTVEVTLRARVRLVDCWADERNTPEGSAAQRYLQQVALQKEGLLEVEIVGMQRLDDAFSFGRILGRIYIDGADVSQRVVRAGHAKASKGR